MLKDYIGLEGPDRDGEVLLQLKCSDRRITKRQASVTLSSDEARELVQDLAARIGIDPTQNQQHEIDRLRLLLTKAGGTRKALMAEIEPAPDGFRVVVTGMTPENEMAAAQLIGEHLAVLLQGSVRWTIKAISQWPKSEGLERDQLERKIDTLARPADTAPLPPDGDRP